MVATPGRRSPVKASKAPLFECCGSPPTFPCGFSRSARRGGHWFSICRRLLWPNRMITLLFEALNEIRGKVKNMRAVWRYPILALAALGVLGIPNPARAQNAAAHSDEYNNFVELNIYGGYSNYWKNQDGLGNKIQGGAIIGGRVTENIWNYFALEQDVNVYSWNKYQFLSNLPDGTLLQPAFPIHTVQPAFDGVLHFT